LLIYIERLFISRRGLDNVISNSKWAKITADGRPREYIHRSWSLAHSVNLAVKHTLAAKIRQEKQTEEELVRGFGECEGPNPKPISLPEHGVVRRLRSYTMIGLIGSTLCNSHQFHRPLNFGQNTKHPNPDRDGDKRYF
jgi:hypothetical protein